MPKKPVAFSLDPKPEAPPAPSSDGVSTIAEGLIGAMPEPQQHAIDAHNKEQSDAPKDKSGAAFDPTQHATGRDGKPVITAEGTFRRRRGTGAGRSTVGRVASIVETGPSQQEVQARAAGKVAANVMIQFGMMLGGPEWAPNVIKLEQGVHDERINLENAFGEYFVSKNWTEFPPGLALTVVCVSYALPRFAQPETRRRGGLIKAWFKMKWSNWRNRRARGKHDGTQSDTRHNGVGENDAGKETQPAV